MFGNQQGKEFADGISDDLFDPIPIGRGSPASLGSGSTAPKESQHGLQTQTGGASYGYGVGGPAPPISISEHEANGSVAGRSMNSSPPASSPEKSFPAVLHSIVSNEDTYCIHWLECGTRFVIANKEEFTQNVLAAYFPSGGTKGGTTKFTSFTRRLKRWNFSRVPSGREMGAYYHAEFKRGEPEMAARIQYPGHKEGERKAYAGPGGHKTSPTSGRRLSATKRKVKTGVMPKGRRRASTGSMAPPLYQISSGSEIPTTFNCFRDDLNGLDNISPTPIKPKVGPQDVTSVDMQSWLRDTGFTDGMGESNNANSSELDKSLDDRPAFALPPQLAFPNSVMAGGGGGQQLQGMMRRRSMEGVPPNKSMQSMFMSNSFNSGTSSLTPTQLQLLGQPETSMPNFTANNGGFSHSNIGGSSHGGNNFNIGGSAHSGILNIGGSSHPGNLNIGGPSNGVGINNMTGMQQSNQNNNIDMVSRPEQVGSINGNGHGLSDLNNDMLRDLSFGDLKVMGDFPADPFT